MAREPGPAPGHEFRIVHGLAHEVRHRPLAPHRIRHPHHRHLAHGGMAREHLLDGGRIDVLPARHDDVVRAAEHHHPTLHHAPPIGREQLSADQRTAQAQPLVDGIYRDEG